MSLRAAWPGMALMLAAAAVPLRAAPDAGPRIVNLGTDFKAFWDAAKAKPLSEQKRLWDLMIEAPHQRVYDSLVWNKKHDPDWRKRKEKHLPEYLKKYPTLAPKALAGFASFEPTLTAQMARFREIFPDADLNIAVFAVPSAGTFNGHGGELDDQPGRSALIFGVDMIADRDDPPGVLYSHELFHIYHFKKSRLSDKDFDEGAMTLPLWLEGLATYVSGRFNPKETDGALLMDERLSALPAQEVRSLAARFLKIAGHKGFDAKNIAEYKQWFGLDGDKLRPDLPSRCGYLLGLHVARRLAQTHALGEMAAWGAGDINKHALQALRGLSAKE